MALKFDPPKHLARYALFVDRGESYGGSRYTFKPYDNLGHAKLGWHSRGTHFDSKILENINGEWYTLFDISKDANRAPWQKQVEAGGWRHPYKTWKAKPMTRDEYANWRIKVEHEKLGLAEYSSK